MKVQDVEEDEKEDENLYRFIIIMIAKSYLVDT